MCLLKWGASFLLLVGMMATTLAGQSAFAQDCSTTPADSTGNTSTGGTSNNDCTTTFNAYDTSGLLTLAAPAVVTATNSDLTTHQSTFTFDSTVSDDRSGLNGWNLQASSDGLNISGVSGNTVYPSFDTTGSITPTSLGSGTCPTTNTTLYPITTLGSIPSTFASAPANASAVNCSYAIVTNGAIDFSGKLAGSYTGTVTLQLLNTAAGL